MRRTRFFFLMVASAFVLIQGKTTEYKRSELKPTKDDKDLLENDHQNLKEKQNYLEPSETKDPLGSRISERRYDRMTNTCMAKRELSCARSRIRNEMGRTTKIQERTWVHADQRAVRTNDHNRRQIRDNNRRQTDERRSQGRFSGRDRQIQRKSLERQTVNRSTDKHAAESSTSSDRRINFYRDAGDVGSVSISQRSRDQRQTENFRSRQLNRRQRRDSNHVDINVNRASRGNAYEYRTRSDVMKQQRRRVTQESSEQRHFVAEPFRESDRRQSYQLRFSLRIADTNRRIHSKKNDHSNLSISLSADRIDTTFRSSDGKARRRDALQRDSRTGIRNERITSDRYIVDELRVAEMPYMTISGHRRGVQVRARESESHDRVRREQRIASERKGERNSLDRYRRYYPRSEKEESRRNDLARSNEVRYGYQARRMAPFKLQEGHRDFNDVSTVAQALIVGAVALLGTNIWTKSV